MTPTSETRSVALLNEITRGLDFSIPDIDFNDDLFNIPEDLKNALLQAPSKLTPGDLTERVVNGMGMYDQLMTTNRAHLMDEYENNRITGAEYTKAYIALSQSALQFAVQYLLGRDQAYYTALGSVVAALKGSIDIYTAKVQLAIAQAQAHQNKAQYANTVMALAVSDTQRDLVGEQIKHTTAQTELVGKQSLHTVAQTELVGKQSLHTVAQTELVGKQSLHTVAQTTLTEKQADHTEAQTELVGKQSLHTVAQTTLVNKQADHTVAQTGLVNKQADHTVAQTELVGKQTLHVAAQTNLVNKQVEHTTAQITLTAEQTEQVHAQTSDKKRDNTTTVGGIMGGNINLLKQQKLLTVEQTEQAHAQTSDKKIDNSTAVTGYVGHQTALLDMQAQAFRNDAVIKGVKIYTDSFATQASMGTATVAGTGLAAADINTATTKLQAMITKNSA